MLSVSACGSFCGKKVSDESKEAASAAAAASEASPEPATPDPFVEDLAQLEDLSGTLPPPSEVPDPEGPRKEFVDTARTLGERAIAAQRPDVAAQIGRLLSRNGEFKFAEAFLQRAVGLMDPKVAGKDHLYALAELRRASVRPLEAASLFERAVHIEPTTPMEYVGLSKHYLAAARPGPARAAVTRGQRNHAGSAELTVQAALVAMTEGRLDEARSGVDAVLQTEPANVAAKLVRLETRLAQGELDAVVQDSTALQNELPADAWGWIFGAAALRAQGKAAEAAALLDRAKQLAGDCPCTHDERLAIAWAEAIAAAPSVSPRNRAEIEAPPPRKPGEPDATRAISPGKAAPPAAASGSGASPAKKQQAAGGGASASP
jgi:tetratricopeptide (TPR) repeat protein